MKSLNCQSLNQDKADLIFENYLQSGDIMILCFCETWCKTENISFLHIDKFINVANFCRSKFKGGGVGIWAHSDLNTKPLDLTSFACSEKDFEICGISISPQSNKKIVILTCYRSPDGNLTVFCNKLFDVLESLYNPNVNIILNGDFNLDPQRDARDYAVLGDILSSFNIFNIVDSPTRGNYLLDHVYTQSVLGCVVEENSISDHRSIRTKINYFEQQINGGCLKKRSFSSHNTQIFYDSLERETWLSVFQESNVNTAFKKFHEIFLFHFNNAFPNKNVKINNSKKHWTLHKTLNNPVGL